MKETILPGENSILTAIGHSILSNWRALISHNDVLDKESNRKEVATEHIF